MHSLHVYVLAGIILLQNAIFVRAIDRTLGPTYDSVFQNLTAVCNATNQTVINARCTDMIDCVYGNVSPSFSQTLSIGANIAGLLPTILVLIGVIRSERGSIELHFTC